MQISLENLSDIERKLSIQIPSEQIDDRVSERLKKTAKTIKLAGFRPGKVPLNVVKRRFGDDIRNEIIGDLMKNSLSNAIAEKKLNLVGSPVIESGESDQDMNFNFTAKIEVYPDVKLVELKAIKVDRPVTTISPADIEDAINGLREQKKEWVSQDGSVEKNDQVTIDFIGELDGKPFEGGEAKNVDLVIGSNQMIPGFEDALIGSNSGDKKSIELTFPEDYHEKALAGKPVKFVVDISQVKTSKLPELDADFFKDYGVEDGGLDKFKEEVKSNLEYEVEQLIKTVVKRRIFNELHQQHEISLPQALVKQEIAVAKQNFAQQLKGQGQGGMNLDNLPDNIFEGEAKKRVALGLILREFINNHAVSLDKDKVKEAVENTAKHYENPAEVIDAYQSNQDLMNQIESSVLEEQVVELILSQCEINDKSCSFNEVREAYYDKNA